MFSAGIYVIVVLRFLMFVLVFLVVYLSEVVSFHVCSGQHGNVFSVGKYCYVVSARRRSTGGGEGRGYIVSPRAQLVVVTFVSVCMYCVH